MVLGLAVPAPPAPVHFHCATRRLRPAFQVPFWGGSRSCRTQTRGGPIEAQRSRLGGKDFRLVVQIVQIDFEAQVIYVKKVMTRAEYSRKDGRPWKKSCG